MTSYEQCDSHSVVCVSKDYATIVNTNRYNVRKAGGATQYQKVYKDKAYSRQQIIHINFHSITHQYLLASMSVSWTPMSP